MSLKFIFILIAGLSEIFLGFYTLQRLRYSRKAVFFFIFTFSLGYWILTNLVTIQPFIFWIRNSYAAGVLVAPAILVWLLSILPKSVNKRTIIFLYGSALLFFFLSYVDGLIIKNVETVSIGSFEGTFGPLFPIYSLYSIGIVIYLLIRLFFVTRNSSGIRRAQLRSMYPTVLP